MLHGKLHASATKLGLKSKAGLIFSFTMFASLYSPSTLACDDKACETAYLASTQQYAYIQRTHAEMYRAERLAHAKNRERRAFALYMHIHQTRFGGQAKKSSKVEEKS